MPPKPSNTRSKQQGRARPRANRNKNVQRNQQLVRSRVPRAMPLDSEALAYARLLSDPCHAPLVHPVFQGAEGAYLIRFQTTNSYGISAGTTSGVYHWIPSIINVTGGLNSSSMFLESTSPAINGTATAESSLYTPGASFLPTNAAQYRCVAACITIQWAGSELTRAGQISYGNTTGSLFQPGQAFTPGIIFPLLNHTERTPAGVVELKWRPGVVDQQFVSAQSAVSNPTTSDTSRNSALTVFYQGLPAGGAGLLITKTAVYEYIPSVALGVTTTPNSRNMSTNTLDQVINHLDSKGDWMKSAMKSAYDIYTVAAPVVSGLAGLML